MPKRGIGYPIFDPYPMNSIEKRQVPVLQDSSKSKSKIQKGSKPESDTNGHVQ